MKAVVFLCVFLIVTPCAFASLHWKVGDWSPCVTQDRNIIQGYRTRSVKCVDISYHEDQQTLPNKICELQLGLKMKPEIGSPCVSDSVIKAHKNRLKYVKTEWSECSPSKVTDKFNLTSRQDYSGGQRDRVEKQECDFNADLTDFLKTRRSECRFYLGNEINDDGVFVKADPRQCAEFLTDAIDNSVEAQFCYRKCVKTCALTLWTKWVRCTRCKTPVKYKSRSQAILNAPESGCDNIPLLRMKVIGEKTMKRGLPTSDEAAMTTKQKNEKQYRVSGWRQVSILFHKQHQFSRFSVYQRAVSCVHRQAGVNCVAPSPDVVAVHKVRVSDRNCVYTDWSGWSQATDARGGKRNRSRRRKIFTFPLGYGGKACDGPDLVQVESHQFPVSRNSSSMQQKLTNDNSDNLDNSNQQKPVTNSKFTWFAGPWSGCLRDSNQSLPNSPKEVLGNQICIVYKKRRHVFCISASFTQRSTNNTLTNLKPVNLLKCDPRLSPKPSEEQICDVICSQSQRCAYKEWSKWNTCELGLRKRRREAVFSSLSLCPLNIQAKKCNNFNNYSNSSSKDNTPYPQWVANPNGTCQAPSGPNSCGQGTIEPVCRIEANETSVNQTLCDPSIRDAFAIECKVPCTLQTQCLYSTWTMWAQCDYVESNETTSRFRALLYGSKTFCNGEALSERKECSDIHSNQERYYWVTSFLGSCQLHTSGAKGEKASESRDAGKCGNGTQSKQYLCVDAKTRTFVEDSLCLESGMVKPVKSLPYDSSSVELHSSSSPTCVTLSLWSDWAPDCEAVCTPLELHNKLPSTSRHRYVVSRNNCSYADLTYAGRNNANDKLLVETRTCPPCLDYHWVVKTWDVCTHDRAPSMAVSDDFLDMHNGFQIRNVFCSDGSKVVADAMCPGPKPIESRECHIDWLDTCNLKPWSSWTECDKFCGKGNFFFFIHHSADFFFTFHFGRNTQRIIGRGVLLHSGN